MTPFQVNEAYDFMQRIKMLDHTLAHGNNAEMTLTVRCGSGTAEINIPEKRWRALLVSEAGIARDALLELGVDWP